MVQITSTTGLVSGIDYNTLINNLLKLDSAQSDAITTQNTTLKNRQTAITALMANLTALKGAADVLGKTTLYSSTSATSSNSNVLSVATTGIPASGTYQYTALSKAQAQQFITSGYESADAAVGSGVISFRFGNGVNSGISLDNINGGEGFTPGSIKITDRGGTSAIIDLSGAKTIDDVLSAINDNGTVDVTASVAGDRLVLTDNSGGTSNLKVQEVNSGKTAASLGLSGINTPSDSATGSDIVYLSNDINLSALNDGIGVETNNDAPDMRYTLGNGDTGEIKLSGAKTLGDIIDKIDAASQYLRASISSDGSRLLLTDSSGGTTANFAVTAENGSKALADLGLDSIAADAVITGNRILSGSKTVLLADLHGGKGLGALGKITLTDRAGNSADVDLSGAETLEDVINSINAAPGVQIAAQVNQAGNGIQLIDSSGQNTSNLKIDNFGDGTTTADKLFGAPVDVAADSANSGDLHLQVIGLNTKLSDLNAGAGVAQGKFSITNSAGATTTVNINSAVKTIGDVIQAINLSSPAHILAEINDTGDGILISDEAGGTGKLKIAENGSTTAANLNLLGTATTQDSTQLIDGSMTRTVDLWPSNPKVIALDTKLSDLNAGSGVARGKFTITNSAGQCGTIDLTNTSIQTIGDLVTAVNDLSINVTAAINETKDGIVIRDSSNGTLKLTISENGSTTARDLNILGTPTTVNEGGKSIQVIDGKHPPVTLQQLCDKINRLGAGITASIVSDGSDLPYRLSIVSNKTGKRGSFIVDTSQSDMSFDQIAEAQDAMLAVGYNSSSNKAILVTSNTNDFNNVLSGATLTIQNVSNTPVTVSVAANTAILATQIKTFINTYNSFRQSLNTYTAYDTTSDTAAVLASDYQTMRADTDLSKLISDYYPSGNTVTSMAQIGINVNDDGTLGLDESTLDSVLSTNLDDVQSLFTTADTGVSSQFSKIISNLAVDTDTSKPNSLFGLHYQALKDSIDKNQDRIDQWSTRLDAERTRLTNQFAQLELTLAKMQSNYTALSSIDWLLDTSSNSNSSLFNNSSSSSSG
jgi:flagellar hook-associated protein 2